MQRGVVYYFSINWLTNNKDQRSDEEQMGRLEYKYTSGKFQKTRSKASSMKIPESQKPNPNRIVQTQTRAVLGLRSNKHQDDTREHEYRKPPER